MQIVRFLHAGHMTKMAAIPTYGKTLKSSSVPNIHDDHDITFEPPRGKTNNVVSEQVQHKPACTSTEKS